MPALFQAEGWEVSYMPAYEMRQVLCIDVPRWKLRRPPYRRLADGRLNFSRIAKLRGKPWDKRRTWKP